MKPGLSASLERWADLRHDALASVVVFLVALPLCMGIAVASGAPPATGIITGIIGGLIVGMLAGSPLQVSGPAAGLTVLVYEIIQEHGMEKLAIVVLLAGIFQITKPVVSKASCGRIGARGRVEETADQMRPLLQAAQDAMGASFQFRLRPGRAAAQFPLHMRPGQLVGVQVG
jgi:hypothetical protein